MSARAVRGIAAASGLIAVLTLLARVVGFGRWLTFSGQVGAGCVGTAYAAANTVPNVLYEVAAGGALAAVAVPVVAGYLADDDHDRADQVVSALLTWACVVLVPLAVVLALVAAPVAGFLLPDEACASQRELATRMLWWFAPQIPLYGIGVVAAGALQARRRFAWPALVPLLSSLVVIAAYVAYGRMAPPGATGATLPDGAVAALAGGTTLGVVTLSLPLLVPLWRSGARLCPTLRLPDDAGRRVRRLAVAGIIALLAQQVAVLATVWIADHRGGTGVLNVYQYVQAVYVLPYAVLAVPVATAVLPSLTQRGGQRAPVTPELSARLGRSVRVVALSGSLGAAVLVAAAPAVGRFFAAIDAGRHHGQGPDLATSVDLGLTSFAPGLLGYGLVALLTRALYVRGRPSVAARWTAAGWLLAAAVPFVLTAGSATAGSTITALGVASSVGMTVAGTGLLAAVRRAWGTATTAGLTRTMAGAALAIPVAGVAGRLATAWWPTAGMPGTADAGGVAGPVALGVASGMVALAVWLGAAAALDRVGVRALVGAVRGAVRRGG